MIGGGLGHGIGIQQSTLRCTQYTCTSTCTCTSTHQLRIERLHLPLSSAQAVFLGAATQILADVFSEGRGDDGVMGQA